MPVPADSRGTRLTIAEFLARDWPGEWYHELIDGVAVAMNPPLAPYTRLVMLAGVALHDRLLPGCGVFAFGGTVRPGDDHNYRIPDLTVACRNSREHWVEEPRLVVEVLSPSTRKTDLTTKLAFYRSIDTIEEILILWSDARRCELYSREPEGWRLRDFIGTAEIPLLFTTSPVPLDDLYLPLEL